MSSTRSSRKLQRKSGQILNCEAFFLTRPFLCSRFGWITIFSCHDTYLTEFRTTHLPECLPLNFSNIQYIPCREPHSATCVSFRFHCKRSAEGAANEPPRLTCLRAWSMRALPDVDPMRGLHTWHPNTVICRTDLCGGCGV